MKTLRLSRAVFAISAALALIPSASQAATNILIQPVGATVMTSGVGNQSSSSGGGGTWQNWYVNSDIAYNIIFDTTNPPPTGSTGSILQTLVWSGGDPAQRSEITFACIDGNFWGSATFDAAQYSSVEMDFKFDTNSTMTPASAINVEIHMDNHLSGGGSDGIFLQQLANTGAGTNNFDGNWHHLSVTIPSSIAPAGACKGPGFKTFEAVGNNGSIGYWVANLELVGRPTVLPPPTMTIEKTSPGLRQFADASPNYNRQNLRTDTSANGPGKDIDWVGHPNASYTWTYSEFPMSAPNFHAGFTLTPDPATAMVYSDPDWSSSNAVWVDIVVQGNGTVSAGVSFKTNQPSANSQFFSQPGQLTGGNTLNAPTAVGTWTVSFANDTSIKLTAPNGAFTNVSLPADVAAIFTNISFALYTGMNSDANAGRFATLTHFGIANTAVTVNEDLTDGSLGTSFLRLDSQGYGTANLNPTNQVFITSADSYWLHWTLPDSGYTLVQKDALTDPIWDDYAPSIPLLNGGTRWVKIPTAALPGPTSYFRLLKRVFTKLQVLLPGETAAPNTLTGKTGTPDPVPLGNITTVTINAVDATFNLVNVSTDVISVTSTDGTAILPLDAPLVNGTLSTTVQFGSAGSWTVTATNLSNPVIQSGTSSSVTVNP